MPDSPHLKGHEAAEEAARGLANILRDALMFWTPSGTPVAFQLTPEQATALILPALAAAEERGAAREREAREDAERKGVQLCNLAGTMMLACKRLAKVQSTHTSSPSSDCCGLPNDPLSLCEACRIPLPELSDEAIESLVKESNAQAVVLAAANTWNSAESEHDKVAACINLRAAVDALARSRSEAEG